MKKLLIGEEAVTECIVSETMTAQTMGSGSLPVLATPAVAALMEKAACLLLAPSLAEGTTTVGTMIAIDHLSATPVGAAVTVKAVLTAAEGRRYAFELTAEDNSGVIARGRHERFLVNGERFVEKTRQKIADGQHP